MTLSISKVIFGQITREWEIIQSMVPQIQKINILLKLIKVIVIEFLKRDKKDLLFRIFNDL